MSSINWEMMLEKVNQADDFSGVSEANIILESKETQELLEFAEMYKMSVENILEYIEDFFVSQTLHGNTTEEQILIVKLVELACNIADRKDDKNTRNIAGQIKKTKHKKREEAFI